MIPPAMKHASCYRVIDGQLLIRRFLCRHRGDGSARIVDAVTLQDARRHVGHDYRVISSWIPETMLPTLLRDVEALQAFADNAYKKKDQRNTGQLDETTTD